MSARFDRTDWQTTAGAPEAGRSLLRDPGRLLFLGAAVGLLVSSLTPWATGAHAAGQPLSYRPTEGLGEGVYFIAAAVVLAILARGRAMLETTSRTLQLLPLGLVIVSGAMWVGANRLSTAAIAEWETVGATGAQTTSPAIAAISIAAAAAGFVWFELRRPRQVRAATQSIFAEWGITRRGSAELVVSIGLGLIGGVIGLAIGVLSLETYGVLLGLFLAIFGFVLGAGLARLFFRFLSADPRG